MFRTQEYKPKSKSFLRYSSLAKIPLFLGSVLPLCKPLLVSLLCKTAVISLFSRDVYKNWLRSYSEPFLFFYEKWDNLYLQSTTHLVSCLQFLLSSCYWAIKLTCICTSQKELQDKLSTNSFTIIIFSKIFLCFNRIAIALSLKNIWLQCRK